MEKFEVFPTSDGSDEMKVRQTFFRALPIRCGIHRPDELVRPHLPVKCRHRAADAILTTNFRPSSIAHAAI
jgi:hypothetical protein